MYFLPALNVLLVIVYTSVVFLQYSNVLLIDSFLLIYAYLVSGVCA